MHHRIKILVALALATVSFVATDVSAAASKAKSKVEFKPSHFTKLPSELTGISVGSLAWGDYDNDGDLDLVLAGWTGSKRITKIYRNDGGNFTDIGAALEPVSYCSTVWADFDNDGDLDLFTGGRATNPSTTKNLISNGSFEEPVITHPAGWYIYGSGRLNGWQVRWVHDAQRVSPVLAATGPVLELQKSGVLPGIAAAAGNQYAELDSDTEGPDFSGNDILPTVAISQTVESIPSTYYNLKWKVRARPGNWGTQTLRVSVNDAIVYEGAAPADWTEMSKRIYCRTDELKVEFADMGDANSYGVLLDDVRLTNEGGRERRISKLYRNEKGTFVDSGIKFPGLWFASAAWADMDNDGDPDLAISGTTYAGRTCSVWRNDKTTFTNIGAEMTGFSSGCVSWGDVDKDGDVDLAASGWTGEDKFAALYKNEGGTFSNSGTSLEPVSFCSLAWGDYDNDGWLDLALAGRGDPVLDIRHAYIYKNTGGTLYAADKTSLTPISSCTLAWGDFDNDGDLDLGAVGWTGERRMCRVYRNDRKEFLDLEAELEGVSYRNGALAWGDLDNDSDLDFVVAGNSTNEEEDTVKVARFYRNDGPFANKPPVAPVKLWAQQQKDGSVAFSWSRGSDEQTQVRGLTYNLRVGTASGKDDVVASHSDERSGVRRLAAMGNIQSGMAWSLRGVQPGTYYAAVQAVDTSFKGSAWSTEVVFKVLAPNTAPTFESHPYAKSSVLTLPVMSTDLYALAEDPENDKLIYTWEKEKASGNVFFGDTNGTADGWKVSARFTGKGTFTVRVKVSDGREAVFSETLTITVLPASNNNKKGDRASRSVEDY
ncbi:MAG: VCBS repeat-containing protein [Planctomycetes bacterium]|nr:VCBS repeat-containing protein [Planctomycetota bacterium]